MEIELKECGGNLWRMFLLGVIIGLLIGVVALLSDIKKGIEKQNDYMFIYLSRSK